MAFDFGRREPIRMPRICHHIVCQHRVEVEVWPATAEVCFRDERFSNPLNAQVQFTASVFNAPSNRVTWKVLDLDGNPGKGRIKAGGLYLAPEKGSLPFGLTDIVVATSIDDIFRQAFARVAIVGLGPLPEPTPRVEVYPHRICLYYWNGADNLYIDDSNKMQLFRAFLYHGDPAAQIQWQVNLTNKAIGPEYLYSADALGSADETITITASLIGAANVSDWATVSVLNYNWPGIIA
jgi:hypothetical protein